MAYICAGGKWTIGYGHTQGVKGGDKVTKAQAEVFLKQDVKDAEDLYYALQFTLPGYTDKFQTVLFGGTGKGDFPVIYTANDLALKWSEGDKFTYVAELYGYQGQVITSQPLATATGEITIS